MKFLIQLPLIMGSLLLLDGCWPGGKTEAIPAPHRLELVSALPVNTPAPLEPSGLTLWNGELFTVADKDDATIYRVEIGEDAAKLIPHIRFSPPNGYRMDWEGISSDPAGNFYLISEEWGRILQVAPDGTCEWSTPDLMRPSAEIGLFAKPNAGFEGVTWIGPGHWLGAVEREPRGLVEYRKTDEGEVISPSLHQHSPFSNTLSLLRIPDFSALDTDDGMIYAIFRNAHLVVRLTRNQNSLQESEAWSYRHIETDPRWAYRSQSYGQAEGLVVDGKDVYIIFDNNLGGRQSDPKDGRPLFVHARMQESD